MAAPTTVAPLRKALANPEPSTHGPFTGMRSAQQLIRGGKLPDSSGRPDLSAFEGRPTVGSGALRRANLTQTGLPARWDSPNSG
jgi:hypothetical protein